MERAKAYQKCANNRSTTKQIQQKTALVRQQPFGGFGLERLFKNVVEQVANLAAQIDAQIKTS